MSGSARYGGPIPILYGTAEIRSEVVTMAINPKQIEEWRELSTPLKASRRREMTKREEEKLRRLGRDREEALARYLEWEKTPQPRPPYQGASRNDDRDRTYVRGLVADGVPPHKIAELVGVAPATIATWVRRVDAGRASRLASAVRPLLAEREEMLAVLREVEWRGDHGADSAVGWPVCPSCGGAKPTGDERYEGDAASWAHSNDKRVGHAPDCRLAALLGDRPR